jgi:hypothetical protein
MLTNICNHYEKINRKYITCQKVLLNESFYCNKHIDQSVKIIDEYTIYCGTKMSAYLKNIKNLNESIKITKILISDSNNGTKNVLKYMNKNNETMKAKLISKMLIFMSNHLIIIWNFLKQSSFDAIEELEKNSKTNSEENKKIMKFDEYKLKIFNPVLYYELHHHIKPKIKSMTIVI